MTALTPDTGAWLGGDLDRPVSLRRLVFLAEGDEVTVGCPDIDSYCVLPADGAALLRELQDGMSPNRAGRWYAEAYGEPVDVEEFLAAMAEIGFLADSNGSSATERPVAWQRLGRAMFSPLAWFGYLALIGAALIAMASHHELAPQTHNMFFSDYATAVLLLGVFGQFPFVLLHEGFHALAGRRLGLHSRLRISRRLNVLVAETALDGLVVVPRRQRYLPILAGMLADLVTIAGLTLLAAALRHPDGSQPLAGRICLALAFATVLRFLWQFYFFLQTDLYQLIVAVLGCVELHRTACRLIANRINRMLGRSHRLFDEQQFHPRDRAVARWYGWVLVAGYAISLGSFLLAVLPLLHRLFATVLGRLTDGQRISGEGLADSALFLALTVAQLAAVAILIVRERRQRRASTPVHLIG